MTALTFGSARRTAATAALAFLLVLPACGGESSGNGGSDGAFCSKLREMEAMPESDDPAEALKQLAELAKVAPNDEVRRAMSALQPIVEKITSIDSGSEDAFGEIMALLFDPDVIKAGEVLDKYSVDVCGMEPSDSSSDSSNGDGNGGSTDGGSGTVFDDIEAGDIGDAVTDELATTSPGTAYSGASMSANGDSTDIQVDLSGDRTYDADALCSFVLDYVAENSTDTAIEVAIVHDGATAATCTP